MADKKVKDLKIQIIEIVKDAINEAKKATGWNLQTVVILWTLIENVVVAVEGVARSIADMTGEQKKELAVTILNDVIDIPAIPEWIEAKVFEFAVDGVVILYNQKFGKMWHEKFDRLK